MSQNSVSVMGLRREHVVGPALTAAVLLAFVILDATVVRIQNPAPIFLIAVTFAGYVGGLGPALVSAVFAIAFSAYYFSIPDQLFAYSPADQARLASVAFGSLTIAVLTGVLRERLVRAERGAAREREARIAADTGTVERRRLFSLMETAPAAIALTRGPDHIIEIANARFRRTASTANPIGTRLRDAFPEVDAADVIDSLDRVYATGETVTIDELPVRRAGATGEIVESHLNVVFEPSLGPDGRPDGLLLFAADLTEPVRARRRLQALLAEQEAERSRLQMILDQLPEGVTISDQHGTFMLRNQAAERLFPWPDRTVDAALQGAEYLRPDGTPYSPDELPGARARRGETVQGEELLVRVREPFHEVPILMSAVALRAADGSLLGTLSVFQDITPRQRIERERAAEQQERRDSDTRLRATVAVALDALISMDTAGRITDWNPSAEAMFGWRRDDIVGQEMATTIVPERYRAPHREGLRRFLETGQVRVLGRRIEIEALHRDGHEFPIELAISAIETSRDRSFTAFVRDISARRRLEAAQAAALVEVQQSLRLRDEFLSAAAHDLKTPLTSVKGHIQLVRKRLGGGLTPGVAASLAQVEHSTDRMADLISELLDVARLQSGETLSLNRRQLDLVALTRSVADTAARDAPRHSIEVVADVPTLLGNWDPARVERALTNLLSNAVKYSPGGGEIRLTVSRESQGDQRWAVLSVRDRGIGIPAADLPRLFTRFHRGANAKYVEGTGIGLEATRRMIELHDGTVGVESTEGVGTTVTVRLPIEGAA